MARFRFRLQPVLRQRELAERDEQLKVAELERRRLTLEADLREQQRGIELEERALHEMLGGGKVDPMNARAQNAAILRERTAAQKIAVELAAVYKKLELARGELTQAAASRRSMELLRDNQHASWKKDLNRREDAMIDELAVLRAARDAGEMA